MWEHLCRLGKRGNDVKGVLSFTSRWYPPERMMYLLAIKTQYNQEKSDIKTSSFSFLENTESSFPMCKNLSPVIRGLHLQAQTVIKWKRIITRNEHLTAYPSIPHQENKESIRMREKEHRRQKLNNIGVKLYFFFSFSLRRCSEDWLHSVGLYTVMLYMLRTSSILLQSL